MTGGEGRSSTSARGRPMKTLCCVAFAFVLSTGCGNPSITTTPDVGGKGGSSSSGGKGGSGSGGSSAAGSGGSGGGFNVMWNDAGSPNSSGGSGGTNGDETKNCGQEKFKLELTPAELVLVLD